MYQSSHPAARAAVAGARASRARRTGAPREMEAQGAQGPRERRGEAAIERPEQNHVQPQSGTNELPRQSYWLDLWLFILLDLVLFFVYLMS